MRVMRVFSLTKDLWWMLIPLVLCVIGVFIKMFLPYGFGITLVIFILWMITIRSETKNVMRLPIRFSQALWFFLLTPLLLLLIFPQLSLRFPFNKFFLFFGLPVNLGSSTLFVASILIFLLFKYYIRYYTSRQIRKIKIVTAQAGPVPKKPIGQKDFSQIYTQFYTQFYTRQRRLSFFKTSILTPLLWALLVSTIVLTLIEIFAPELWSSPFTTATVLILIIAVIAFFIIFLFLYKAFPKYKGKFPTLGVGGTFIFLDVTFFFMGLQGLSKDYPNFKFLILSGKILIAISIFSMILMFLISFLPKKMTKKSISFCFAIGMSSLIGSIIILVAGVLVGDLLQGIPLLTKSGWVISI